MTPAGIEKFFEELSEAAKQNPLDLGTVKEIAEVYDRIDSARGIVDFSLIEVVPELVYASRQQKDRKF